MNDEECRVYMLRGPVVCIETGEDQPKRIYLSQVPRKPTPAERAAEQARKIEAITNVISGMMSAGASVVMVLLVAHMIGIF